MFFPLESTWYLSDELFIESRPARRASHRVASESYHDVPHPSRVSRLTLTRVGRDRRPFSFPRGVASRPEKAPGAFTPRPPCRLPTRIASASIHTHGSFPAATCRATVFSARSSRRRSTTESSPRNAPARLATSVAAAARFARCLAPRSCWRRWNARCDGKRRAHNAQCGSERFNLRGSPRSLVDAIAGFAA